jgi:type II secretory pathway pseudopilin PulG
MSTTELIAAIALVAILAVALTTFIFLRKRRNGRLRSQFRAAEYAQTAFQAFWSRI